MIPYGRQDITQADIDAVTQVLRSDFITQGPAIPHFENSIATRVNARHAIAVNSATSALHIACMALELGPRDLLWTVPNTFVASANCGLYCGADVDFVDIDPLTWNMSLPKLREKLMRARSVGRLPKIVIPVHFSGQPTEQEGIKALSEEFGFKVIEDASHSIGASRNGEPVGSCRWSDITVFSFHPVKIITSGEGGLALTNDPVLAGRLEMLRTHGITRDAKCLVDPAQAANPAPWYYEQQMLGFNYRMTDIHAALGLSQLTRLTENIERRNVLAARYDKFFAALPLQLPRVLPENRSAFHLYVVRLKGASADRHRQVFTQMRERGIGVNLHYTPVHLQPYYRRLGFEPGRFPESETYAREAITLPLYATLSESQQDTVVAILKALL